MTTFESQAVPFLKTNHAEVFIRPRLNTLLAQAIKKPLVIVCAGMGYGKTIAVSDFVRESEIPVMWMQFSEFDNVGLSFWGNFTRAIEQFNKPLAEECKDLGFPDTEDKLNQFFLQYDRAMASKRYLAVLDDVHLIKDAAVMNFIEHIIYNTSESRSLILICRETSNINVSGLLVRGLVSNINENDLSFTENELAQYLHQQGLSSEIHNLPEIFLDTEGWAFIVNFLVRILKSSPGYTGYIRAFMKENIFQLMEREAWNVISHRLQHFLVRLSLVKRLSADLVSILADEDEELLAELNQQRVVYLRFDRYTGLYLFQPLFLDYLHSKRGILSPEEIDNTYKTAAAWCVRNGFSIDALTYYEKVGDYESLVTIILESPTQLLLSVAQHLKGIFERAPGDIFDKVEFFACAHVRIHMLADPWQDTLELLKSYERKFLRLPSGDEFRNRSLKVMYYLWGVLRQLMCTVDDVYDFDMYYKKVSSGIVLLPAEQTRDNYPVGPWLNRAGFSRQGAPQEYLDAIARSSIYLSGGANNWMEGQEELGRGELLFYRGDVSAAKLHINKAVESAKRGRQYVTAQLAMFYPIRIAIFQGNYANAEQALKDMESLLEENEFYNRFSSYDIAVGWYFYALRQPEKIPDWLKGKLKPSFHANLFDNIVNQIKVRYYYLTKDYAVLLAYMEEQKRRESILYGRLEMLAIEACARYQMRDKEGAFAALQEAYEAAAPNDIVMPFIEMGKDMRTLTLAALREPDYPVPGEWLKSINKKASVYARHQTLLISDYKKANEIDETINLTNRETEVLNDLNKGLSRSEIAISQGLSINTVRLIINTIYEKLRARNIADLIRIAHEEKLI